MIIFSYHERKKKIMKKITQEAKTITGFKVRTKNEDEMNPKTAKIGALWQNYFEQIMPTLGEMPPPAYGVYSNYESDAFGEFDVLVGGQGVENIADLETVTLEEGNYLCFEANGELPQAVIDTWGEIWSYFSDENCSQKRLFKTDYECYMSQSEAKIYIGVA